MKEIAETQLEKRFYKAEELESFPRFLNPPLVPNYMLYNLVGLRVSNCEQWYYYDFDPDNQEVEEFVGTLDGTYFEDDPENSTGRSGMLGNIPNYLCRSNMKRNPYFVRPSSSINEDIYDTLKVMNEHPIYNRQESIYLSLLPDGAVTFYSANSTHLKYKAQINDQRFTAYHRNNAITKVGFNNEGRRSILTITDGMLTLLDMIHTSYLRKMFNDTEIISLVQYMPIKFHEEQELHRLLNIMGASLYPIALSLLLPVFMYAVVLEKEERLQEFMKMNGLQMKNYWIVNFLFNFLVYSLTILVFMTFGAWVVELQFFTQTNRILLCILLAGWGIAQISLSFFFQVFIDKARTATIWGYLLSIWTVLWGITLNLAVYPLPDELPWYFVWYPHFGLTRAIYILSYECGYWKCIEEFSEVPNELTTCIICIYVSGILFLILGLYLNEVMPKTYGVPRHPLFCLRRFKSNNDHFLPLHEETHIDLEGEDNAVKEERRLVHELEEPYYEIPLVIKDIRKVYKGKGGRPNKLAVKKLCLRVHEGELFGLLGPNGAGKTSLISMLTGLYKPDGGNAYIAGFDIIENLDQVQLYMGVCPQFDILWPELTVQEHLLFYARLKGSKPEEEESRVRRALEDVYLEKFSTLKTSELSGGMRRRLSVAISLVGNPKIVFLDEPTTGLDPENRRQLWDILANCKGGRAMVLTTHSMEEADVLCSRIAIINHGILRCIGPQVALKSQYGGGYHLFINCHKDNRSRSLLDESEFSASLDSTVRNVRSFVEDVIPHASILTEFNGNLVYQVPIDRCKVSSIFREFETHKNNIGIDDWGISQSSLEDVFLRVIGRE
jgi:ABC-type multidrug transport system ATPase subunit